MGGFRVLAPSDPATAALRRLVRTRSELVAERTRLANRLRGLLEDAWPGAAEVFARVDSPIGLDFLERYPSPRPARTLGEARLASFLVRHHYCGRRTAGELLARLRAAPVVTEPAIVDEATADAVRALVACLRTILGRLADLEGAIRVLASGGGSLRRRGRDVLVEADLFEDPRRRVLPPPLRMMGCLLRLTTFVRLRAREAAAARPPTTNA